MKNVEIYGICWKCERNLEELWDYTMSLADYQDPEREVRGSDGDGYIPLV
jgi:hypothetical protein